MKDRRSFVVNATLNEGPNGESGVSGQLAVSYDGMRWRAIFSAPYFLATNEIRTQLGSTMCKPSVLKMVIANYKITFPKPSSKNVS